jgi:hypothetical protein
MTLTKTKMLTILAKMAVQKKLDIDYTGNKYSEEEYYQILSTCDELNYNIDELYGLIDDIRIEIIEDNYKYAEDNDLLSLVLKFTDIKSNSEGYLEFKGRYSSWDSSSYYLVQQVHPRKIEKTIYVTKLDENY